MKPNNNHMKFGNMSITDVSCVVFKSTKYPNGDIENKKVKTVKWDRKPAAILEDALPATYNEEYAWVCVNARMNGEDIDSPTIGCAMGDKEMISLIKRLYNSPKYDKWFHSPTINIDKL